MRNRLMGTRCEWCSRLVYVESIRADFVCSWCVFEVRRLVAKGEGLGSPDAPSGYLWDGRQVHRAGVARRLSSTLGLKVTRNMPIEEV